MISNAKLLRSGTKVRIKSPTWPSEPLGVVDGSPKVVSTLQGEDYQYLVVLTPPVMDIQEVCRYRAAMILSQDLVIEP